MVGSHAVRNSNSGALGFRWNMNSILPARTSHPLHGKSDRFQLVSANFQQCARRTTFYDSFSIVQSSNNRSSHEARAFAFGKHGSRKRAEMAVPYGLPGSFCHASQV